MLTTQLHEITMCFIICICYSLAGIHVESVITTCTVPNTVAQGNLWDHVVSVKGDLQQNMKGKYDTLAGQESCVPHSNQKHMTSSM